MTFKSFDNEQGDEKEDSSNLELSTLNETETTLEPSSPSSWKDDTKNYLILLGERSKDLDNVYGVRKLTKDRLMIGDSPISFSQNNIHVGNLNFPKVNVCLNFYLKNLLASLARMSAPRASDLNCLISAEQYQNFYHTFKEMVEFLFIQD